MFAIKNKQHQTFDKATYTKIRMQLEHIFLFITHSLKSFKQQSIVSNKYITGSFQLSVSNKMEVFSLKIIAEIGNLYKKNLKKNTTPNIKYLFH